MYQNQPDPKVIAAEKSKKELVIKEAKAKKLDKVVAEATVAVAATDSTQLASLEKTWKFCLFCCITVS
jgi:YidC/Oxa1 family membrane protein insertase